MTDLLTFIEATKGTSLKIEVTSKDLLEFADALVERAAAKARAEIERQSDVEYIPKKEAIDLLGVCDATLWHWARSGYLVPVKLGRRVFYRRTDIQRLLNLSVMPGSDRASSPSPKSKMCSHQTKPSELRCLHPLSS